MPLTACPDDALLLRLLQGRLRPRDAEPLESHLETCDGCAGRAETLGDIDDLLGLLRGHEPPAEEDRRAMARIADRASRLGRGLSLDGDGVTLGGSESAADSLRTVELPGDLAEGLGPPVLPDEIGRLGPFRVLDVLGMGGMGVVFRAEYLELKRPVALKVIHPSVAGRPDARPRFLREARALAALDHPHVVPLHSAGEENGLLYLEMPLLRGETLRDRLMRSGRLPAGEAAAVGRAVAEALVAGHAAGLVHRDLKPGNVWLGEAGPGGRPHVRLFDFGLVGPRDDSGDPGLTVAGSALGTPGYAAPEQAGGGAADARSELYGLGCVLYEALTGVGPFAGDDAGRGKSRPPHEMVAGVPRGLSELVLGLLAEDSVARPGPASAVAEALLKLEDGTRRDGPGGGGEGGGRLTLLLVLLLLNAGGLLGWWLTFGVGIGPPGGGWGEGRRENSVRMVSRDGRLCRGNAAVGCTASWRWLQRLPDPLIYSRESRRCLVPYPSPSAS